MISVVGVVSLQKRPELLPRDHNKQNNCLMPLSLQAPGAGNTLYLCYPPQLCPGLLMINASFPGATLRQDTARLTDGSLGGLAHRGNWSRSDVASTTLPQDSWDFGLGLQAGGAGTPVRQHCRSFELSHWLFTPRHGAQCVSMVFSDILLSKYLQRAWRRHF